MERIQIMRVVTRLKGIHKQKKRTASGAIKFYYFHRATGTRLPDDPSSQEFLDAYKACQVAPKPSQAMKTLETLADDYQDSVQFKTLGERTAKDYVRYLVKLKERFGTMPIEALADRRCRQEFLGWRDKLADRSLRGAEYQFMVFARLLSWAKDRGITNDNPLEKIGKIYKSDRIDKIWTRDDEANFLKRAPESMVLPFVFAIWTGQRQGDILTMPWSAYDGSRLRFRQRKSGRAMTIPVGGRLKEMLDAMPRTGIQIIQSGKGAPYTTDGFKSVWRRGCAKVGIEGLTFHDLRGTAVTRLALSGATESEIATITGHSLASVREILDAHYLSRDPALAESGIAKLQRTFGE
jgi:integrase